MSLFALPQFNGALHQRVLLQQLCCHGVGIERRSQRNGILLVDIGHGGQGLNHQPGGVVGIFHSNAFAGLSLWLGDFNGFGARSVQGEGEGGNHLFAVGQDGQVVLFTIAETLSFGCDTTNI